MNALLTQDSGFFSLAELVGKDFTEVEAVTSRLPARGIYHLVGEEIKASEQKATEPDQNSLFNFQFISTIMNFEPLDKNVDAEKLIGKKLYDRYTIWTKDQESFFQSIAELKGRYKLIGLPTAGAMGGLEGHDPGFLDGIIGFPYRVRVRHWTDKSGVDRAQFDWLPPEKAKAADPEGVM